MVKLVVYFKRRAGMEVEPFQDYWRIAAVLANQVIAIPSQGG